MAIPAESVQTPKAMAASRVASNGSGREPAPLSVRLLSTRLFKLFVVMTPLSLAAFGVAVCPSVILMNSPCPGCGLTRATTALFRGDIGGAMAYQPLALLVCPFYVGLIAYGIYYYLRYGEVRFPKFAVAGMTVAAVGLLVVWVARMFLGAFGGAVPVG